ncbi:hypothetical protein [Streptomyces sp. NPDC088794]|uniref:hypothetical protein n=1 Tax=Streptomyces sp. NPDC088794 TaxID=3365902 RepID=UPI00381DF5B9
MFLARLLLIAASVCCMAGGIALLGHARRKGEAPNAARILAAVTLTLSLAALATYLLDSGGLL